MVMCCLIYEIQILGSHYFEPTLPFMITMCPRNEVPNHPPGATTLTVFQMKGSPLDSACKRCLHMRNIRLLTYMCF